MKAETFRTGVRMRITEREMYYRVLSGEMADLGFQGWTSFHMPRSPFKTDKGLTKQNKSQFGIIWRYSM
jgi:hypothetical protein